MGANSIAKPSKPLRIVFLGTYDRGKPRVRLLLEGARAVGIEVVECHSDLWKGIEDKSQITGLKRGLKILFAWLCSYPSLIWRYLRLPSHDAVLVGYMGQLDVLILKPFAFLRGVPVFWDAFLSLYDTTVNDRRMVSRLSPLAWILYLLEWFSCRAADMIFLDTQTHARYFERLYGLPAGHIGRVFVGAETKAFHPATGNKRTNRDDKSFTVLFYGQFIPLHGIDIIVKAVQIASISGERLRWILIGRGQESLRIDRLIREIGVSNIERIPWVPYDGLIQWIEEANVCLGIFGITAKASRVIPNKVYQILSAGRSLITADTPAIRELLKETAHIKLIPPGNPEELAKAVLAMKKNSDSNQNSAQVWNAEVVIGPAEVGRQFLEVLLNFSARQGVAHCRK